jgi:hypothetical protein
MERHSSAHRRLAFALVVAATCTSPARMCPAAGAPPAESISLRTEGSNAASGRMSRAAGAPPADGMSLRTEGSIAGLREEPRLEAPVRRVLSSFVRRRRGFVVDGCDDDLGGTSKGDVSGSVICGMSQVEDVFTGAFYMQSR